MPRLRELFSLISSKEWKPGRTDGAAGYQQKTFLGRKRLAAPGAEQLFPAHDIVPFDHRGDTQPITLIFLTALDPHYFAGGSH